MEGRESALEVNFPAPLLDDQESCPGNLCTLFADEPPEAQPEPIQLVVYHLLSESKLYHPPSHTMVPKPPRGRREGQVEGGWWKVEVKDLLQSLDQAIEHGCNLA